MIRFPVLSRIRPTLSRFGSVVRMGALASGSPGKSLLLTSCIWGELPFDPTRKTSPSPETVLVVRLVAVDVKATTFPSGEILGKFEFPLPARPVETDLLRSLVVGEGTRKSRT